MWYSGRYMGGYFRGLMWSEILGGGGFGLRWWLGDGVGVRGMGQGGGFVVYVKYDLPVGSCSGLILERDAHS